MSLKKASLEFAWSKEWSARWRKGAHRVVNVGRDDCDHCASMKSTSPYSEHFRIVRVLLIKGNGDCCVNVIVQLMFQCSYQSPMHPPSAKSQVEAETREGDIVRILKSLDLRSSNRKWVSEADRGKGSLLHYATRAGFVERVKVLIGAGLDINCIFKSDFVASKSPTYSADARSMRSG